jgi:hypothetical protein
LSELTGNRIRTTATKLGLPHLAETINEYTRVRADEGKMGHLDFLDLVLSELAVRDDRRVRQGLRLSRLTHQDGRSDQGGAQADPAARPRERAMGARPTRPSGPLDTSAPCYGRSPRLLPP